MPRMISRTGGEFECTEDFAREFERKGIAKRVSSQSPSRRGATEDHTAAETADERRKRRAQKDSEAKALVVFIRDYVVPAVRSQMIEQKPDYAAIADQVIAAGEKARSATSGPVPTGVAAAIIAAGKKARGEE